MSMSELNRRQCSAAVKNRIPSCKCTFYLIRGIIFYHAESMGMDMDAIESFNI